MKEMLTQDFQGALLEASEEPVPEQIFKPASTETPFKELPVSFQMGVLVALLEVLLSLDP